MINAPSRILCIGSDFHVMQTRVAVLTANGYSANHMTAQQSSEQLSTGRWDLVIISRRLNEEHPDLLANLNPRIQVLSLDGFIMPAELLKVIARKLADA